MTSKLGLRDVGFSHEQAKVLVEAFERDRDETTLYQYIFLGEGGSNPSMSILILFSESCGGRELGGAMEKIFMRSHSQNPHEYTFMTRQFDSPGQVKRAFRN